MFNDWKFMMSIMCEYAYILNMDTMKLETYEGLNANPDARGRYARFPGNVEGYFGVRLTGSVSFDRIRNNCVRQRTNVKCGFL